jgi:hypothetical protein
MTTSDNGPSDVDLRLGRLEVSERNPRYFAVAAPHEDSGHLVYLTGSHVNNNFHDGLGFGAACSERAEVFDFDAYLGFLVEHGHNFVRLWRWEQFKGYLAPADVHLCMTPQPWERTGPGLAKDGKPRFDLTKLEADYFDRLRHRVLEAGRAGIYVSVMLFEGFSLHLTATPDNIEGHPFCGLNNVNGVGITSIVDYQVLPLDPRVRELQEAYIRKVIDTVHDLPNVLFEVANESSGMAADKVEMPGGMSIDTPIGDSTEWQYWVIDTVKRYEAEQGYDPHPVGMTFQYPVADQARVNDVLWDSPADWISPGFDDGDMPVDSRWFLDPPANDGRKVVISDNDHYSPMFADAAWAWKSFARGHNPILYDLGIVGGPQPADPSAGTPSYDSLEPARFALGDTLRYARGVDLAAMEPRGDLSSSNFALADVGREYLVVHPAGEGPELAVRLSKGTYRVQWHDISTRTDEPFGTVEVDHDDARITFRRPGHADADVVLWLRAGD